MDDETTLFIMGDHGMTISGDHGGDSDDETNALLFAYTKKNKFYSSKFGSDTETLQQVSIIDKIKNANMTTIFLTVLIIHSLFFKITMILLLIVSGFCMPSKSRHDLNRIF